MTEKSLRCAIYTRKSTEDGLEQEFNSLDAQYEACAAYALSQQHEGWALLDERYDDGGFSGGNMDRPGLTRLLADIADDKIDIVLLYKIDRLTRSLTDFAKIVEVMDKAGASFVSITQSFNNTTSMGRLTLNMLLSFAQFEREVTGERIRDKIAASKKKGLWMGGPVPLGYEVRDRKLVVKEDEARQVRHIMRRYLALGTVPLLVKELEAEGYRTKVQKRTSGPHKGGCLYRRGTLYHLLSNRIYRGMTLHKGKAYPGEHEAIVEQDLWDQVQALLRHNACGTSRRKRHQETSLLVGKVFDGVGRAMTPNSVQGNAGQYRYYVTRPEEIDSSPAWRVGATDLEGIVCRFLARKIGKARFAQELLGKDCDAEEIARVVAKADIAASQIRSGTAQKRRSLLRRIVNRIDLQEARLEIRIDAVGIAAEFNVDTIRSRAELLRLAIPVVRTRFGHELRLIVRDEAPTSPPVSKPKLTFRSRQAV